MGASLVGCWSSLLLLLLLLRCPPSGFPWWLTVACCCFCLSKQSVPPAGGGLQVANIRLVSCGMVPCVSPDKGASGSRLSIRI